MSLRSDRRWFPVLGLLVATAATPAPQEECLSCHGSVEGIQAAAESLGAQHASGRLSALVVTVSPDSVHASLACGDCHPRASQVPTPRV
ncbi:MAG: hypothetical protein ACOY7U_02780 [Acidobacteriota bacterium]